MSSLFSVETDIVLAIVLEAIEKNYSFQLLKNDKRSFFKTIIFLKTIVFHKKIANESGFYDN